MQFPKIAFIICALATASTSVRADDNAEQAAARAALVSKLFEIGEATPTNAVPSVSTTTKVRPVENPAMHPVNHTAAAPVIRVTPNTEGTTTYHVLSTPHQAIQNPPMNATKSATAAVVKTAPVSKNHVEATQKISTPPMVKAESHVTNPVTHSRAVTENSKPKNTTTATATATAPVVKTSSEFAPIIAPALPLSGIQQQKLLDLLAKYKADQITPEEYHRQRAAIISGM